MSDGDAPSFQTKREPVASNTELQWGGGDGKAWSDAIDTSTGITVSDSGSVQTGTEISDSGVARYRFEQNLNDAWNDNDGTDNSSTGYSTTAEDGSYSKVYDGVGDYWTAPLTPQPQESESIFVWVYRTTSKDQRVLTAADSADKDAYYIKVDSSDTVEVRQHDGNTATDRWEHGH